MSFKIKFNKTGSTPVLSIYGDITGSAIGKLTAKLESIQSIPSEAIALDLSNVSFIDSHGLGVFVFFYRRLSEEKRRFIILKPSEFIVELFSESNLDKIFTIIHSEDEL